MNKKCSKCRVTKPASEFRLNSYAKDGLQSQCKQCISKRGPSRRAEPTPWSAPVLVPSKRFAGQTGKPLRLVTLPGVYLVIED